jgi:hypothetical protein
MNLKHNMHLLPQIVIDLVDNALNESKHENERSNYLLRLETIRDYCNAAINKYNNTKPIVKSKTRVMR